MKEEQKLISLAATGLESPNLVSDITSRIYHLQGNIIDVEESCRRGLFSIFLVVDFSSAEKSLEKIVTDLRHIEEDLGLKVIVTPCDVPEMRCFPGRENHIVTIVGVDQPGIIAKVSTFFKGLRINIENCRMIARGDFFSMEMIIDSQDMEMESSSSHAEAIEKMKAGIRELCAELDQSVIIQSENIYNRAKKLVVFDVESTLIQAGSIQRFLDKIGGRLQLTDGRLNLTTDNRNRMQSLIDNAKFLKGIPVSEFEKYSEILQVNPGAFELIKILKSMGFKIALLSSGLNFFVKKVFQIAGVDYAFSNTLKTDENGVTTGELETPIITSETKDEVLEFILNIEKIGRDQVIAVGDGSSCSHFIKNVGLSIAFKPDGPIVQTDGILSSDHIFNILYCLGIPEDKLESFL